MADGGQERQRYGMKFLDTLRPGQRLQVASWLNSPIGPHSTHIATYISHLAKDGNILPLTISHWTQMPAIFVLNAMSEVKKVFDYPDDLNDWVRGKLHDRWKSHKHIVKKEGFYKYNTQEERLAHRPKDVVESQWGPLIEYWQNPKQDAICAQNKQNKSKRTVECTSGRKPHVKYAAELEAKLKRPPTAQEIYDATHAKQKKQVEGLENKQSQHSSQSSSTRQNGEVLQLKSPVSSSKKRKMCSEESVSWGIKAVCRKTPKRLPLSRSNSIPTSPIPQVQECVTEDNKDNMQAESDEGIDGFDNEDNRQAQSDEFLDGFDNEDNMQGASGESAERFGPVVEPVEAARMTSSSTCPTVYSELVSMSNPEDISVPFVESTSISCRQGEEEFVVIDNFKIRKEYAVLYKKIFDKYGHMATRKVIKSSDTILEACVTSLLKIISAMETVRGADLSELLLERWEGGIKDVENLGFNITWLIEKFNEVKNNWNSSSGIRKEVEVHEKELDATQVKYVDLLARKEELQREIQKAEAKISAEKKAIQQKLAPKNSFFSEPVLGKVLG